MKKLYKAKRLKHQKRRNLSPVYTSLLSMLLCMVCLVGTSWAWFTSNQEVAVAPIRSAQWALEKIEVYAVSDADASLQADSNAQAAQIPVDIPLTEDGAKFDASANTRYVVSATLEGSASQGFLLINTCDGSFYSEETETTFSLLLSQDCTVTISTSWGTYTGTAVEFNSSDTLGNGAIPTSLICTCEGKCTEENVDFECEACVADLTVCEGTAELGCTCTEKCAENAANSECVICSADYTACEVEENVEPPVCTCTDKCVDTGNENCSICQNGIEDCEGKEKEILGDEQTTTEPATTETPVTSEPPAVTEPSEEAETPAETENPTETESATETEPVTSSPPATETPAEEANNTESAETTPTIVNDEQETASPPDQTEEDAEDDGIEPPAAEETTES